MHVKSATHIVGGDPAGMGLAESTRCTLSQWAMKLQLGVMDILVVNAELS